MIIKIQYLKIRTLCLDSLSLARSLSMKINLEDEFTNRSKRESVILGLGSSEFSIKSPIILSSTPLIK